MNTSPSSRHKPAIIWAIAGMALMAVVFAAAIFRSTSSTAAIGLIFIPLYVLPFGALFYLFGYCLRDLGDWIKGRNKPLSMWARLRAIIVVMLPLGAGFEVTHGILLVRTVERISKADEAALDAFLKDSMFKNNRFALGALAVNPNATTAQLDHIARLPDPALHRKMGSIWPVMPGNGKGLAVMRLVARHKNVSESTLVLLAESTDAYVLGDVVANSKTPVSIIRQQADNQDQLIRWGLAANPATPSDMLQKLATDSSEYTRARVADNPNTPAETLELLSTDQIWHVRRSVASNKNTPLTVIEKLAGDPDKRVSSGAAPKLRKAKARPKRAETKP